MSKPIRPVDLGWIDNLNKHYPFSKKEIEKTYIEKFQRKFKDEKLCMMCFEAVIAQAMTKAVGLEFEVINYFIENDIDKIRQRPFRIQGKINDELKEGCFTADVTITVYDWDNPGIEHVDTLGIDTQKKTKMEALESLKQFAKEMSEKMSKDFGVPAQCLDLKSGKML